MTFKFKKKFLKGLKKLNASQKKQVKERLKLFKESPSHPSLNNHKLTGALKQYCSINISGDLRVHYKMAGTEITFLRIGTHSELY